MHTIMSWNLEWDGLHEDKDVKVATVLPEVDSDELDDNWNAI